MPFVYLLGLIPAPAVSLIAIGITITIIPSIIVIAPVPIPVIVVSVPFALRVIRVNPNYAWRRGAINNCRPPS